MQLSSRGAKVNSAIQFCKFLNAMVLQGVNDHYYPFVPLRHQSSTVKPGGKKETFRFVSMVRIIDFHINNGALEKERAQNYIPF